METGMDQEQALQEQPQLQPVVEPTPMRPVARVSREILFLLGRPGVEPLSATQLRKKIKVSHQEITRRLGELSTAGLVQSTTIRVGPKRLTAFWSLKGVTPVQTRSELSATALIQPTRTTASAVERLRDDIFARVNAGKLAPALAVEMLKAL